jgi:hypothetical protein
LDTAKAGKVVRRVDDLKSAVLLSSIFAVFAAIAVPLLLPALPAEARSLPLPVPVFCCLLAVQLAVVYGSLGWAGLRLARFRGLEPAPILTALVTPHETSRTRFRPGVAIVAGVACGAFLIAAVATIRRFFPGTLPDVLHPSGLAAAFVASMAGSLGEEILFRLFLVSLLLRALPARIAGSVTAVGLSSLAFAAAHAPAFLTLFGSWRDVPHLSWVWLGGLNGLCGISFGILFLRRGIEAAVLAHLVTDVVWHVGGQLFAS